MIKTNQTINVTKTVQGWLAMDQANAEAIIFGLGQQERHTPYRMNNILKAYQSNTTDDLPPISYAPQFGEVIDGRHRLAVAYLMGIKTIQADLHYS